MHDRSVSLPLDATVSLPSTVTAAAATAVFVPRSSLTRPYRQHQRGLLPMRSARSCRDPGTLPLWLFLCITCVAVCAAITCVGACGPCQLPAAACSGPRIGLWRANIDDNLLDGLDFSYCKAFTILDLGENTFSRFPDPGLFGYWPSLESLYLGFNALTAVLSDLFSGLGNLKFLDLGGNNLASLPPTLFDPLSSLIVLFLDRNSLSSLPAVPPSLQELYASRNALTTVSSTEFANLPLLTFLALDGNQLTSVASDAFSALSGLLHLFLGDNMLTFLPIGLFDPLPPFVNVSIANNDLTSLPSGMFNTISLASGSDFRGNPWQCTVTGVVIPTTIALDRCTAQWTVQADLCASDPCENGGTCYNNETAHFCACPIMFTGATCGVLSNSTSAGGALSSGGSTVVVVAVGATVGLLVFGSLCWRYRRLMKASGGADKRSHRRKASEESGDRGAGKRSHRRKASDDISDVGSDHYSEFSVDSDGLSSIVSTGENW